MNKNSFPHNQKPPEAAAMAAESRGCRPAAYSRRHPEQTVLYRVVQQHLEIYLMLSREGDWDGHAVPASVERDFRRYLECGILAYGFARDMKIIAFVIETPSVSAVSDPRAHWRANTPACDLPALGQDLDHVDVFA